MRSIERRSEVGVRRSEENRALSRSVVRPPTSLRTPNTEHRTPTSAFTLVEMLVAVALVMLLMSLFAQIFQIAGGSVSTQRGVMENDQRARSVRTLIQGDLAKRTVQKVIPFAFNEELSMPETELRYRRGYFYISENDPANDTDDVLAFTVDASITTELPDELPYYGRALALAPENLPAFPGGPTSLDVRKLLFFRLNANQPETEDGRLDLNFSATSPVAEVVYFLRNGNLYRRVLLVRDPSVSEEQPSAEASSDRVFSASFQYEWPPNAGPPYLTTQYPAGFVSSTAWPRATTFWNDFDYSAHPRVIPDTSATPPPQFLYDGAEFNSTIKSLQVSPPLPSMLPGFQFPEELCYPPNRFGHNTINPFRLLNTPPGLPFGGQPREFGTGGWWVGRLTMEESSNAAWTYPQLVHPVPTTVADANNPMNATVAWDDADATPFVIDGLQGGPRRGEDLLLANVHSFDVKVWDEILGRFVDLGHLEPAIAGMTGTSTPGQFVSASILGDFHLNNRINQLYGPDVGAVPSPMSASANRVFDTWYPFQPGSQALDFNQDTGLTEEDANNDGVLSFFNGDTDTNGNGTLIDHENGPPFRPRKYWALGVGDNATPNRPWLPRWIASNSYNQGDRVFPLEGEQSGDPFYYVCTTAPPGGGMSSGGPTSPLGSMRIAGLKVGDGPDLIWQCYDNRKPLRAIQITLRFLDPSTQQMRTLTIQHSLVKAE